MSRRTEWINPFVTDVSMVPEGTELGDMTSEDGGTLVIQTENLTICMDSPLDVRDFLSNALIEVEQFIKRNELDK